VLDGFHPACREAFTVADTLDLIDNRYRRIAGQQKIAMERMGRPVWHYSARCGDKGLPDDLPAKDALPANTDEHDKLQQATANLTAHPAPPKKAK
jgi:hypothetical protein